MSSDRSPIAWVEEATTRAFWSGVLYGVLGGFAAGIAFVVLIQLVRE